MDAPQLDYGDMVMAQMAQRLEAVEAENAQLRELCREAYHELNCGDEGDVFDRTHFCGRCDNSIDRNGTLRGKLALAFVMVPNVKVQGQDEAQLRTVPLERPVGREEE